MLTFSDLGYTLGWAPTHYYLALRTPTIRVTCNPNNLQFDGLYLLIKGYLLLNCRFLEPQVTLITYNRNIRESQKVQGLRSKLSPKETNSGRIGIYKDLNTINTITITSCGHYYWVGANLSCTARGVEPKRMLEGQ